MSLGQPIGEVFDPFGAHLQDPFGFYARARQESPVFFAPAVNAWVVTRYDDVQEALQQPEVFSSANALRPSTPIHPGAAAEFAKGYPLVAGIIDSDGETHRRLRAPLVRALSPARVDATEPLIQQRAEELVDGFVTDGHADLMAGYADRLPVDVISHLFGFDAEDVESAYHSSTAAGGMLFSDLGEDEQAAAVRGYVALQHLCARNVHARRAQPGGDVVSEVVTALAPGQAPLTPEQETLLVVVTSGVFIAGHITTTALIGNGLRLLLADRAQWERLCDQPELIADAVEEIARFGCPPQGFFRVTTRPVTLGGVALPAGAEVLVGYASANRDTSPTDRPEVFDITRAPTRHLAFAAGVHACVGAGLARRELAVTLRTLTRRLPGLRLAPGHEPMVRRSLAARGPVTLHATW